MHSLSLFQCENQVRNDSPLWLGLRQVPSFSYLNCQVPVVAYCFLTTVENIKRFSISLCLLLLRGEVRTALNSKQNLYI